MRSLILTIIITFGFTGLGAVIPKGATVQVKADSIWFQDAAALARWQALKKSGNQKALAGYEDKMLSDRDAWQFTNQLAVKVLSYEEGKHQVNVEMTTPGRMLGTKWWLDTSTLVQ
ncbi:MAG: hypothetical protein WAK31_11475 [Chthoniobacterales bacterium]